MGLRSECLDGLRPPAPLVEEVVRLVEYQNADGLAEDLDPGVRDVVVEDPERRARRRVLVRDVRCDELVLRRRAVALRPLAYEDRLEVVRPPLLGLGRPDGLDDGRTHDHDERRAAAPAGWLHGEGGPGALGAGG